MSLQSAFKFVTWAGRLSLHGLCHGGTGWADTVWLPLPTVAHEPKGMYEQVYQTPKHSLVLTSVSDQDSLNLDTVRIYEFCWIRTVCCWIWIKSGSGSRPRVFRRRKFCWIKNRHICLLRVTATKHMQAQGEASSPAMNTSNIKFLIFSFVLGRFWLAWIRIANPNTVPLTPFECGSNLDPNIKNWSKQRGQLPLLKLPKLHIWVKNIAHPDSIETNNIVAKLQNKKFQYFTSIWKSLARGSGTDKYMKGSKETETWPHSEHFTVFLNWPCN